MTCGITSDLRDSFGYISYFFAPSYMFINILENRGKVLNDIQGMLQQMRFSS